MVVACRRCERKNPPLAPRTEQNLRDHNSNARRRCLPNRTQQNRTRSGPRLLAQGSRSSSELGLRSSQSTTTATGRGGGGGGAVQQNAVSSRSLAVPNRFPAAALYTRGPHYPCAGRDRSAIAPCMACDSAIAAPVPKGRPPPGQLEHGDLLVAPRPRIPGPTCAPLSRQIRSSNSHTCLLRHSCVRQTLPPEVQQNRSPSLSLPLPLPIVPSRILTDAPGPTSATHSPPRQLNAVDARRVFFACSA